MLQGDWNSILIQYLNHEIRTKKLLQWKSVFGCFLSFWDVRSVSYPASIVFCMRLGFFRCISDFICVLTAYWCGHAFLLFYLHVCIFCMLCLHGHCMNLIAIYIILSFLAHFVIFVSNTWPECSIPPIFIESIHLSSSIKPLFSACWLPWQQ